MNVVDYARMLSYSEADNPSSGWRAPDVAPEPPPAPPTPSSSLSRELKNLDLIFAGNAIFTIRSRSTGTRFTYRVRLGDATLQYPKPKYFVSVLIGPENVHDYQYVGFVNHEKNAYAHGRKSRVGADAPAAQAITWFFQKLFVNHLDAIARQAEIFHEGRCCRCGRTLTVPESIESGIGPECATRL